jgi:hypothetical protein
MCTEVGKGIDSREAGETGCTYIQEAYCKRSRLQDIYHGVTLRKISTLSSQGKAIPNASAIYLGIKRSCFIPYMTYCCYRLQFKLLPPPHMNKLLLGLSLRFSYSHLLFRPTLALPVDGVGVPGVALLELSPNRLLLIELL